MALTRKQVLEYLEQPPDRRPFAKFEPERLTAARAFSTEQVARLRQLADTSGLDARAAQRLSIDLSWASSQLEGNTYSRLDSEALIEWGASAPDKTVEEATMVLNHKRAVEALLSSVSVKMSVERAMSVHSALMQPGETIDSRHFLPHSKCGLLREYGDVYISGSSYFPPANLGPQMREHLEAIIETATAADPVNGAFHYLSRLPYLQPFLDGNKRTSRLLSSHALMAGGMLPHTFVGVDRADYLRAVLAFYELGHEELMMESFVGSYAMMALREKNLPLELRAQLPIDYDDIKSEVIQHIIRGSSPSHPVIVAALKSHTPAEATPQKVIRPREG